MKKIISSLLLIFIFVTTNGWALKNVPEDIKTFAQFHTWVVTHFYYQIEGEEYWKSPQETIRDKGGDCEDFAVLFSAYLSEQNIENMIVLIQLEKQMRGHAICVWRNKLGYYELTSNYYWHYNTATIDLETLIKKYYPTATRAWILNNKERWYKYNPKPQRLKQCTPLFII